MDDFILESQLTIKYYKSNAVIRYYNKPFEVITDYVDIPEGLEQNGEGKWYIKAKLPEETVRIISKINEVIKNKIYCYWGKKESVIMFSDCFDYSKENEMYLKIKYRYKKFETKVKDIAERPASIYQLNKTKKGKLRISLGSAFKEGNSIVLLWTVEEIKLNEHFNPQGIKV